MTDSSSQPNGVLIVDDDESICAFFKMSLNRGIPGARVETALGGKQALDAFSQQPFEAVILDNHMPELDGRDVYLALEEHCSENDIPMPAVLFCTGYEPSAFIMETVAQNSDQHYLFRKPVTAADVIAVTSSRLSSS